MHLKRNHALIGVLLTFSSVQLVARDRTQLAFSMAEGYGHEITSP